MIIDSHQHFWKVDRGDYFWMTDEVAQIRRDILPSDLEAIALRLNVSGTILVQAADTVAETDFLLDLAEQTALVKGVVGWVDLEDPDLGATLERLAINPKLKGIRPMLQDIEDTDWILRPQVLKSLEKVQAAGLRFDALILPRHLGVTFTLAKLFPNLPIVIDHCAKPVIAGGRDAGKEWRDGMSALAELPNVHCKVSGLATEYGTGWEGDALEPVVSHVVEAFGPDRIMWGSDWPVLELAGDYVGWLSCAKHLTERFSVDEIAQIFGITATRFYGLEHSDP